MRKTKVIIEQDIYQAPEPGQISMNGLLGNRMDIRRGGRLKSHLYHEEMLLSVFRKHPGSDSWQKSLNAAYAGEFVGKWLHSATWNKFDGMLPSHHGSASIRLAHSSAPTLRISSSICRLTWLCLPSQMTIKAQEAWCHPIRRPTHEMRERTRCRNLSLLRIGHP